jgi:integrase
MEARDMPSIKLTDAAVQKLKAPKGSRVEYFDAGYPGFGLRISAGNPPGNEEPEIRKTWILMYRFGGAQRRLTFGPYPALSLAEARKKASAAMALLSEGKDPAALQAEKKAEAARLPDTVTNVFADFMKRHMEGKKRAQGYIDGTQQNFDNHVLPRWGKRDIKSITRRDVIELLDDVKDNGTEAPDKDGKKKHRAGGPIAANRVLATIRLLFNWALKRDIVQSTPASLVDRPGEEASRERTLAGEEIAAVWNAAQDMGAPVGDFFRVVLLTGQRREEVASMRWADLDLEKTLWVIPKEKAKGKRAHVVPLAPSVVDILNTTPQKSITLPNGGTQPSPWVFTVSGENAISGFSKAKQRIDKKIADARAEAGAEPIVHWTTHDLRRTCATEMGRLSVSRFIIGKVLSHADRTVTGVYDRFQYLEEKRHALKVWAQYVDGLVNPRPPAEVADLKEARAARRQPGA